MSVAIRNSKAPEGATVAVVLSNFNDAQFLPTSLSAICQQTRPADQILVIDDGSTDNSWDIIKSFASDYPNLEAHSNQVNLGLQQSIRMALPRIRCDYLVWAASDDQLLPAFLEENMNLLKRYPGAALSFSEVVSLIHKTGAIERLAMSPIGGVRRVFDLSELPEFMSPDLIRTRMEGTYLPISSNTVVVRVDRLREFGGFPSELQWYSDSFTYTALAARYGACVLPRPLALIRARSDSYSQSMHDEQRQITVLDAMVRLLARDHMRYFRDFMRDCPTGLSVYGTPLFRVLKKHPKDWDLLLSYGRWHLRHYSLNTPGRILSAIFTHYQMTRTKAFLKTLSGLGAPAVNGRWLRYYSIDAPGRISSAVFPHDRVQRTISVLKSGAPVAKRYAYGAWCFIRSCLTGSNRHVRSLRQSIRSNAHVYGAYCLIRSLLNGQNRHVKRALGSIKSIRQNDSPLGTNASSNGKSTP